MNFYSREGLVAKCGLDCSICELYLSRENQELFDYLVSLGIPQNNLPCPGCNHNKGKCSFMIEQCETFKCSEDRDLRYCFECEDFPCEKLQPIADGADKYPHNLKLFNLSVIKSQGIDYFLENSRSIKDKYFKSKFFLGKGAK